MQPSALHCQHCTSVTRLQAATGMPLAGQGCACLSDVLAVHHGGSSSSCCSQAPAWCWQVAPHDHLSGLSGCTAAAVRLAGHPAAILLSAAHMLAKQLTVQP